MNNIPVLSIILAVLTGLLMLLPEHVHPLLYFDTEQLARGQWWRLFTGHWIHADGEHLLWNLLGLGVLAAMLERQSKQLLLWSVLVGIACVDMLLVSPWSSIQLYCGLSGVLNTLLGVALFTYWYKTRSRLVLLATVLCLAKIAVEVSTDQSLFTHTRWPPFALAHLAGILGAPVVLWFYHRNNKTPYAQPTGRGRKDEYLVTGY